jgi:two-component system, sensor histidine kinase and response regulator
VYEPQTSDIVNLSRALDHVGGDLELLREIAELFLEDSQLRLEEIRSAVIGGDSGRLFQSAHTLKGAVSNFGAQAALEAALRLERMGRAGQLEGSKEALRDLEFELERLRPVLLEI